MENDTVDRFYGQKAAAKFLQMNIKNFKQLVQDKAIEPDLITSSGQLQFSKEQLTDIKVQIKKAKLLGIRFDSNYQQLVELLGQEQQLRTKILKAHVDHGKFACLVLKLQSSGMVDKNYQKVWYN
jgi:uncharacterized protein YktA (UPF0223 family)